ncbi:cysteine dioxygenase [Fictibacillus sp. 26RED30]|uniref:cysteine dioxygenase n=1 Tax=Fictibacillus sp. 26RED30 TaxID=2745877 RepID=UPI0018CD383E|nr:cysteine dioxygenase family protein [Fictibacillus sp. 26RED30]MBH0160680.1 cysteine dioxygenase family protein [Fictibacillus sp. 26RED30]
MVRTIQKSLTILDSLSDPSKEDLKTALISLNIELEDVQTELKISESKPYYRKLLYQNEDVELLVMNWSQLECAPHDHGSSQGWIKVLSGSSKNTVYEISENGLPSELFTSTHTKDQIFYAPKRGIHKMKAEESSALVTLHLYSPPISGMKVYDLEKCSVCVVSDDCGAWWPDEQRQKLKEVQLNS